MSKVEENKRQKEQKLLNAAFALYTTQGVTKTSIADIAKRSGIAKGTFYLYFHDKYEIEERLIADKSRQIFYHALEHSDFDKCDNFSDSLIAVADDILEQFKEDKVLLKFINKNLSWALFHRALDQSAEEYFAIIESALDRSGEKVDNLLLLLYTIIELIGGSCYSVILEEDPVGLEEYKPYLYKSIRAIIESYKIQENP